MDILKAQFPAHHGGIPRRYLPTGIVCAALLLFAGAAAAQNGLFDYQEYEKRVRSAQQLGALRADAVLGDRTSSFDGSTDFIAEDVSLPGNFDLPVRITRRFGVDSSNRAVDGSEATGLTLFDDWEIEVPAMSGVWTNGTGWVTLSNGALTTQRCTANAAPQVIEGHGYENIGFGIDVKWIDGVGETVLIPEGSEFANAPGLDAPKWITASKARFTCLAATRNGYPGEGFVGYSPDGKKYFFDWGVEKPYAVGKYADGSVTRTVGRKRVYLLASRVEDRFGNWVTYAYTGYRLNSIEASDGRRIDLTYDGQGRVATVTANGRIWRYAYTADSGGDDAGLSQVTLPDGSSWRYSHTGHLRSRLPFRGSEGSAGGCEYPGGSAPPPVSMTATAPSGATGVFEFEMTMFIRSDPCNGLVPSSYDVWSLKRRTLTGPGLASMVEQRNYNLANPVPGSTGRWVNRVLPSGVEIRERYGVNPATDERKVMQRQVIAPGGGVVRDETNAYVYGSDAGAFPLRIGRSLGIMAGQFLDGTLSAISTASITQDEDTYSTVYSAFDRSARPTVTTRSGPAGTRSERRQILDTAAPWVLDQTASVTETSTGTVVSQFDYTPLAQLSVIHSMGSVQQRIGYRQDGTISQVQDALGNTTLIADWHRGVPRTMTHPDGTVARLGVDDNGWITSQTDEVGLVTGYAYDPMGRVREVTPPVDEHQWQKTTITLQQVAGAAYGVPNGHWRIDKVRGPFREETYLDALWQPLLARSYDSSNPAATETFTRKTFDTDGRTTFVSYPSRNSAAAFGVWTEYDALGRVTASAEDSEQGVLVSTRSYVNNSTVVSTDAAGHQSIMRYEAFGAPDYTRVLLSVRPDGSRQTTVRNVFGLPTEISQSAN